MTIAEMRAALGLGADVPDAEVVDLWAASVEAQWPNEAVPSQRFRVVMAVKQMFERLFPAMKVKGLDADAAFPARIPPEGLIVVRNSDPGAPEVDLSPPAYRYEHPIAVEIACCAVGGLTPHQVMDATLLTLGAAVEADRFLGGLCEWLDASAQGIADIAAEGSATIAATTILVTATYVTSNPLT